MFLFNYKLPVLYFVSVFRDFFKQSAIGFLVFSDFYIQKSATNCQ